MKLYYLILFICLTPLLLSSQESLNPCGSNIGRSHWLQNYQRQPSIYPRNADKLYIPLKLHLVGNDNGAGYISAEKLLGSLCTLNDDFTEADMVFYIEGDINFLNNTDYYFHDSVLEGADMMFANNVDNAVNNYIVSRAAGNCGYNLPYAGVCLAINCTDPEDHTWAHELGHAFSLPHPFLGWEGGVSHDGSVSHNFNDPAPERVTYDYTFFKDTLIRDTLIIDTIYVEKVDGSNCEFAADGFCDTKPDYLASRWSCDPTTGLSTNGQTDPNGDVFRSDGSLIMSYANDECSNRFTNDQILAMRANIMDQKPHLLTNQNEPILIDNPDVTLISPLNGTVEDYRYINLQWETVENATYYAVKISTNAALTSTLFETIVSDTEILAEIDEAFIGIPLYWGVIPFNNYDFCHTWSESASFNTGEISSTTEISPKSNYLYPTLLNKGNVLNIKSNDQVLDFSLISINGVVVANERLSNNYITLSSTIQVGIYIAKYNIKGKEHFQKIIIQ
jgi:hypothetical protein